MNTNHYAGWLFAALTLTAPAISAAEQSLWQDLPLATKTTDPATEFGFKHRRLQLDETQLKALITGLQQQDVANEIPLSLPLPGGNFVAVRLIPAELLSADAQQSLPDIHTWRIESTDPAILSGRAELTALGFHAMLLTRDSGRIYIEPEQRTTSAQSRNYHSHSHRANAQLNAKQQFSCGELAGSTDFNWQTKIATTAQRAGEELLTYDLAMAATGEYTQQFGGSKIAAQSAIVTTINRINGIFKQELALQFRLVDNSRIVYTDPLTDPYTSGSAYSLLSENQANLDNVIGSQNYDIGHVLGVRSGGDGLAIKDAACQDGVKAAGTTSASGQLTSDAFVVDFVAHELGHQLGATHTFNSGSGGSCGGINRTAVTAYEPGSGGTIMSYAGLCGSNDFQSNVDPQLHPGSVIQIRALTRAGHAASCADKTHLNNALPVVNAGADYTIPARTPFILNGSGSDANGDTLLYSWDQMDAGYESALGVDTANNALIKSSSLSGSPVRNIPNIGKLLSQSQAVGHGESLPRSDRTLNFRLTARDGKGGIGFDDKKLTVVDTGQRFEILSPGSNVSAGTKNITWNVAGTRQAPINCSHVDIAYTNNQGKTFTDLLTNTPNDGSASVVLSTTAQRIRVKCHDNVFFALSGTAPHIATFGSDDSQNSNSGNDSGNSDNNGSNSDNGNSDNNGNGNNGNNDSNDNGGGGGGSLPSGLILSLTLLLLFRKRIAKIARSL